MRQLLKDIDLLVIGEINADIILSGSDPVPEFGQVEKLVDTGVLTVGSSSVITAMGAARLGLRTAFVGVVGDDALGRFMLSSMEERGVDTSGCVINPAVGTGISVVLNHSGSGRDRAILTALGSIGTLRTEDLAASVVVRARHIHCGSYFLQTGLMPDLADYYAQVRRTGTTCSVDPNWDPYGEWDSGLLHLLEHCDMVFLNLAEALHIAHLDSEEGSLSVLGGRQVTVALKRGAAGASVQRGSETLTAPAPFVDQVVDTTGAGDSFNAGFLYGMLCGLTTEESLALALACGSLSTRAMGGTPAQPTLDEALSLASSVRVQPHAPVEIGTGDYPTQQGESA